MRKACWQRRRGRPARRAGAERAAGGERGELRAAGGGPGPECAGRAPHTQATAARAGLTPSLVTSTMGAAVVHDDDDDVDTEGGSDEDDGSDG